VGSLKYGSAQAEPDLGGIITDRNSWMHYDSVNVKIFSAKDPTGEIRKMEEIVQPEVRPPEIPMKECGYCHRLNAVTAKDCRHCGEDLQKNQVDAQGVWIFKRLLLLGLDLTILLFFVVYSTIAAINLFKPDHHTDKAFFQMFTLITSLVALIPAAFLSLKWVILDPLKRKREQ
jgi:hypothetical protein